MAFYFPIVFNHSLMSFGKVDLKNALTPWVYFPCSNYCCVKEKQTTESLQTEWLTDPVGSHLGWTRWGWLVSAPGSAGHTWGWGWLDGRIRVEASLLPSCGYCRLSAGTPSHVSLASPFQMPSRGLAVWSPHVGLFGLLYSKAGEFHCESKKRSRQKRLCHLLWAGFKNPRKAHRLY